MQTAARATGLNKQKQSHYDAQILIITALIEKSAENKVPIITVPRKTTKYGRKVSCINILLL